MMTRLNDELVKDIVGSLDATNEAMREMTGMDMFELACDANGVDPGKVRMEGIKAGVVPVTSGLGVISKFSESVAGIVGRLGMDPFVTAGYDVTGFTEAISKGAEIVFMADDTTFMAYNVKAGMLSNNSFSTAAGYVSALRGAAKGLVGRNVLIMGAGRVGGIAAGMLTDMGAKVSIYDIDLGRTMALVDRYGATPMDDANAAVESHDLILNASPAHIPGRCIRDGSIISSPGIPHDYDMEGRRKAMIIHNPLDIGVAVMAVQSTLFLSQSH